MIEMRITSGTGRAIRTESFVAFSMAPIAGLDETLTTVAPASVFKRLAALVVEQDFALPPFVVVAIGDNPSAFVQGDIDLNFYVSNTKVAGSSSSTWIERPLTAAEVTNFLVGQIEAGQQDVDDVRLIQGVVPADGLVFGDKVDEPTEDPDPIWEPAISESTEDEDDERDVELDPSWDPLQDPGSVDLAALGSVAPRADQAQPPPNAVPPSALPPSSPPPPALTADTPRATDDSVEENGLFQRSDGEPQLLDHAYVQESTYNPTDSTLLPPASQPVGESMPAGEPVVYCPSEHPNAPGTSRCVRCGDSINASSPIVNPPTGPTVGRLVFDDGQVAEITVGLFVGRYPVKNGMPPGYEGVVVRSEHVSRVHWEVFVEDKEVFVRDHGSHNGTMLQQPGTTTAIKLEPNLEAHLAPGAILQFGDRWARFDS